MSGRIFAVVGPSGAGKDTLIAAACARRPGLVWARRAITRPESAGGEPFEGVSVEEFARRRAEGAFALWWEAHGLLYGVPTSVLADSAAGKTVIFNGSRAAMDKAHAAIPDLAAILVTAPRSVLAERLASRARESREAIEARLTRETPSPEGALTVINDSSVEEGAARLLAAIDAAGAIAPGAADGRPATRRR